MLAAVAVLSFAGSILETPQSATLAYYSLGTRAWELAAGALVALSLPLAARLGARLAGVLTWTGVACIATAAMILNNSTPYPGGAALLPVAGAVAIIFAGSAAAEALERGGAARHRAVSKARCVGHIPGTSGIGRF